MESLASELMMLWKGFSYNLNFVQIIIKLLYILVTMLQPGIHAQLYINVSLINIRWLSVQLDFVGAVIVFSAAMFATLQRNYPYIFGFIDPGLAGMSISQAFMVSVIYWQLHCQFSLYQMTLLLAMVVRLTSDLESSLVSIS